MDADASGSYEVQDQAVGTVTADIDAPTIRKATHYENGTTTPVLEIAFSEDVDVSNGDAEIGLSNGSLATGSSIDISNDEVAPGLVQIETTSVYNNVQNVSVTGVTDTSGNELSSDAVDVTYAPSVVNTTDDSQNYEAFSGENVALESNVTGDEFDIDGPGVSRTRGTGANSLVYVVDTDGFEAGDYNITNDAGVTTTLEISNLGLEVEADEENFTTNDAVTATVTSDAINRDVTADLLDDDGDVAETVTGQIDSDGQFTADFGTVSETGTYSVEVTDVNAGVTATSGDFNVNEAPEGDISFEESFVTQDRGDNANITINFEGDLETAYLTIGDEEEVGYETNVTVNAEGEDSVTVGFNTYGAGNDTVVDESDIAFVADDDSDATVTVEGQSAGSLDNMLAAGTYSFAMSEDSHADVASGNADAVGDLQLEERSVEGFQLWTTSADVFEDVENVEDITSGAENGTVVQTDTLAEGDVLVHQLTASGFEGAIREEGSLANLIDAGAIDLRIRQTADTTAPNSDRKQANVSAMIDDGDIQIISVEGEYFLAFNENNLDLDGDSVDDEDAFEVRVQVRDERLLDPDEDELEDADDDLSEFYETATATFEYQDATAEFDTPVEAEAAEGQSFTGTTNVAPGQEFTVRVNSDSDVSPGFVLTAEEVTVQEDGTFTADGFDFSDTSVNDTFTVTAQQATFDAEEDGTVVEQIGEAGFLEVSELSPAEATATAGDSVTVSATIENTGGNEVTQSVALTLDGDELDSQEVTLGSGETTTVEFTADTSGLDAGDYTHGIATDDDEATGTLTIEAASDDGDDGEDGTDGEDGEDGEDGTDGEDGEDGSDGEDGGDGGTDDSTPGFGALVALVALIAAALLATRRNE